MELLQKDKRRPNVRKGCILNDSQIRNEKTRILRTDGNSKKQKLVLKVVKPILHGTLPKEI